MKSELESNGNTKFGNLAKCYGAIGFFLTITHNVFLLYYVDMFVNVFNIDKTSFWIGELLFLVWNSVNDPLFGWISDRHLLHFGTLQKNHSGQCSQEDIIIKRIRLLQKYGPLYAASFMLVWIKCLPTAIQFAACLCIYDGFLTVVDLQHTSLMADITVETNKRNMLNKYCTIFSALGSASVFVSYMVWNKNYPFIFQTYCLGLTIVSATGFFFSSKILLNLYENSHIHPTQETLEESSTTIKQCSSNSKKTGVLKYMQQQISNNNFRCFISMNLIQVFHCHFNSNFFPLFMEVLIGKQLHPGVGSLLIGISFVVPHINNVFFLRLCKRYGLYNVINGLFLTKLILAIIMLNLGTEYIWAVCLFVASNRVFTEGTCKLLNLVLSDMVDEDFVLNNREHATSALLFGMSSLLSKPGQTLAPLVGTWLLCTYTGEDIFQPGNAFFNQLQVDKFSLNSSSAASFREACFLILVYVPIVCALLQLFAWSKFTLRDHRLKHIKTLRLCRTIDCV